MNYQQLHSFSHNKLQDLYVFDYWIRNADRNLSELGGNPNLFYKQSNLDMIVLDHNLAFDEEFLLESHHQLHVSNQFWPVQVDYDLLHSYEERMKNALINWDDLVIDIPDEWKAEVADFDGLIDQIKLVLNEYENEQFWEGLNDRVKNK